MKDFQLIGIKEHEKFLKFYDLMQKISEKNFEEANTLALNFFRIASELEKAKKYPPFASLHEGYAVLKEEVEEFWDSVKTYKYGSTDSIQSNVLDDCEKELIQIAAMALKNLHLVNEAKKTIQGKSK